MRRCTRAVVFTLALMAARVTRARGELLMPPGDSEYLLRAWGTEDGLPENSATSLPQTQNGYLWFGTFNCRRGR